MELQVKQIIENLTSPTSQWQESKKIEPFGRNKFYSRSADRLKLFKDICNYHSKETKFVLQNDEYKRIINNLYNYCNLWKGEYDIQKGLYIHGSVGCGKSTIMKIIRDYSKVLFPTNIIRNARPKRPDEMWMYDERDKYVGGFQIVNTTQVANSYKLEQRGENSLSSYYSEKEICFDEFGREPIPIMNYGTSLNVMQSVLEVRYDNWSKAHNTFEKLNTRTHITTNILTGRKEAADLSNLSNIYQPHIADRIREMCNIIHLDGKSFRK